MDKNTMMYFGKSIGLGFAYGLSMPLIVTVGIVTVIGSPRLTDKITLATATAAAMALTTKGFADLYNEISEEYLLNKSNMIKETLGI